jgi:hypothetical protein
MRIGLVKHPSWDRNGNRKPLTRAKENSIGMTVNSDMVEVGAERSGQEQCAVPEVPPHGSAGRPSR